METLDERMMGEQGSAVKGVVGAVLRSLEEWGGLDCVLHSHHRSDRSTPSARTGYVWAHTSRSLDGWDQLHDHAHAVLVIGCWRVGKNTHV